MMMSFLLQWLLRGLLRGMLRWLLQWLLRGMLRGLLRGLLRWLLNRKSSLKFSLLASGLMMSRCVMPNELKPKAIFLYDFTDLLDILNAETRMNGGNYTRANSEDVLTAPE